MLRLMVSLHLPYALNTSERPLNRMLTTSTVDLLLADNLKYHGVCHLFPNQFLRSFLTPSLYTFLSSGKSSP